MKRKDNNEYSFSGIPADFKRKLITIIEDKHEFLVLKGSDPSIKDGCCPNKDVGIANSLIKAGVLESWTPKTDQNSCTVTVYAFKGEIVSVKKDTPVFKISSEFRKNLLPYLKNKTRTRFVLTPSKALGIFLLSFVVFCAFWTLIKIPVDLKSPAGKYKSNLKPDRIKVFFFHNIAHCESCERIELYLEETLQSDFKNELGTGTIEYEPINTDLPSNKRYIRQYNIMTRSIVLSRISNDKEQEWKNLDSIWDYLDSKEKFKDYIKNEMKGYFSKVKVK